MPDRSSTVSIIPPLDNLLVLIASPSRSSVAHTRVASVPLPLNIVGLDRMLDRVVGSDAVRAVGVDPTTVPPTVAGHVCGSPTAVASAGEHVRPGVGCGFAGSTRPQSSWGLRRDAAVSAMLQRANKGRPPRPGRGEDRRGANEPRSRRLEVPRSGVGDRSPARQQTRVSKALDALKRQRRTRRRMPGVGRSRLSIRRCAGRRRGRGRMFASGCSRRPPRPTRRCMSGRSSTTGRCGHRTPASCRRCGDSVPASRSPSQP